MSGNRIGEILTDKFESLDGNDKKELKKFINKLNSFSTTPLNFKHAQRMLPFAQNERIFDIVSEVILNYPIWEKYSNGVCLYDIKNYWYCVALLLCNGSERALQIVEHIVEHVSNDSDIKILIRTLNFFNDPIYTNLKQRIKQ